jgi:hypothetical protein
VEVDAPADAETVEAVEDVVVVYDWDVRLEAVVEAIDVDASVELTAEEEVVATDSVVGEDVDCVETVAVDEELRVELSIGKIATAFAVVQLEMRTIRATIEIRTPTVSRLVVNLTNTLLLGASLNRDGPRNYAA